MFSRVSNDDGDIMEVHLHGGDSSSKKQAMEIVELVKSRNNAEIVSANLCTGSDSKSLAINSRTGHTFTIFPAKQLEHSSDFELKLQMVELQFTQSPLTLSFDGRKMISQVEKINTGSFFSTVSETTPHDTYCGFKPGFLLNNNH